MSDFERKPMAQAGSVREYLDARVIAQAEILTPEEVSRFLELRKAGQIEIVLAQYGSFYLAPNPIDPWGSREKISVSALRARIEERYRKFKGSEAAA